MCTDEKTRKEYAVSVICVFNDKKAFENQLLSSLKNQDIEYEMVALDNTKKRFKSAAEALNYGSMAAHGDVLVYAHQDIYLKGIDSLRLFCAAVSKCQIGTVVGTQGVKEPSRIYYSNITAGAELDKTIVLNYINGFYEVSSVDEGFFGMKKKTWEELKFNEKLCDNWHLYCVEICLHTRKMGNRVFVYPIQLHHFSMGTISLGYMKNLKLLCKEYHKYFKYIWTTCYKVRTNKLYINTLFIIWSLNRIMRGRLK